MTYVLVLVQGLHSAPAKTCTIRRIILQVLAQIRCLLRTVNCTNPASLILANMHVHLTKPHFQLFYKRIKNSLGIDGSLAAMASPNQDAADVISLPPSASASPKSHGTSYLHISRPVRLPIRFLNTPKKYHWSPRPSPATNTCRSSHRLGRDPAEYRARADTNLTACIQGTFQFSIFVHSRSSLGGVCGDASANLGFVLLHRGFYFRLD